MTSLLMVFSLMCGAVVQAIWPTWGWLSHTQVPVLLGLALYYALTHDEAHMLAACLLAGILQDSLSLIPLGYSPFCFCAMGLAVSRYRELVFVRQWITHMILGALSAGGVSLVLSILLTVNEQLSVSVLSLAFKAFGAVILGGVVVPVEFRLMESLDRQLGNVAREDT